MIIITGMRLVEEGEASRRWIKVEEPLYSSLCLVISRRWNGRLLMMRLRIRFKVNVEKWCGRVLEFQELGSSG
jgi:hypothetical protein